MLAWSYLIVIVQLASVGLFLGMLGMLELGRRLGKRRASVDNENARAGLGVMEGAIFGLLGLLVAFTFSGVVGRMEQRRLLVIEEANAIGTAWERLEMLPPSSQPRLRELFRQYLDSRLRTYALIPDQQAVRAELDHSLELQQAIWQNATAACRTEEGRYVTVLVLPSLNQMFDIVTVRTAATTFHTPTVIYVMLFGVALGCSLLAGYGMAGSRTRSWAHMLGFAAVTAAAVYVILDLEYPRLGLFRMDIADQTLKDLRAMMK